MIDPKSEAVFSQFDEIEKRVGLLIEKIESLEEVNDNLESRVAKLDQEVKEKEEVEKQYEQEKAQVKYRIDALLEKIGRFTENVE